MTSRRRFRHAAALIGVLSLAACSDGDEGTDAGITVAPADSAGGPGDEVPDDERYPEVLAAVADRDDATGTWTFQVTMLSPYDTPDRYADGWRIVGPDGTVYGIHTLTHDHADEQPFTRTQRNVEIPAHVDEVTVEGRDLRYGFGGDTVTISVQTD